MPRIDWQHLYKQRRWYSLRRAQLNGEPFCRFCTQIGITTEATVVDHVKPHKGDTDLFFDQANLQSLCKTCHDKHKKRQEHTGVLHGNDRDGYPIDSGHHWGSKK